MPTACQVRSRLFSIGPIRATRPSGLRLIQADDFSSRWLRQHKLIISQRLVELQLRDRERDVVLLLRPIDLNVSGKFDSRIILVVFITHIGGEVAILIVNELPMR